MRPTGTRTAGSRTGCSAAATVRDVAIYVKLKERAERAREALGKKDWGTTELEAILAGEPHGGEKESVLDVLQRLAVHPDVPERGATRSHVEAAHDRVPARPLGTELDGPSVPRDKSHDTWETSST